jgi:endonuclease YncB( thermonuclease family)
MVKSLFLVFTILSLLLPNLSLADIYKVTRVVDGDTLKVLSESGQKTTIRLVGIDAPELGRGKRNPGQPFSKKATRNLCVKDWDG